MADSWHHADYVQLGAKRDAATFVVEDQATPDDGKKQNPDPFVPHHRTVSGIWRFFG